MTINFKEHDMKKAIFYISAMILIVDFFKGCAPLPRSEPISISNTTMFDKPFDAVWTQLIVNC